METFKIIDEKKICYEVEGFQPLAVDKELLYRQGIDYPISDEIETNLKAGSEWFARLFENKALTPPYAYHEAEADISEELIIHNYTGMCPTNVLEVTPSVGSCAVACQYCLVTDGNHVKGIELYTNYAEKVAASLERNKDRNLFYYFSPKTEAFSEPHLFNGMAHDIMREFIKHYDRHPDSGLRMFVATKAGPEHFKIKHKGETLFELFAKIPSKIQVNGSIGIMPPYLRDILEPNAADIHARLDALVMFREMGVWAESVLCQPLILPYLTDETVDECLSLFASKGVKNIKPEFLTTEVRNLVLIAQYINHFDPEKIGEFFYPYLHESNQQHIKQRSRLAPDKAVCVERLNFISDTAQKYGITISICNWVKRELGGHSPWVHTVDTGSAKNGYRCLGYQTNLFHN